MYTHRLQKDVFILNKLLQKQYNLTTLFLHQGIKEDILKSSKVSRNLFRTFLLTDIYLRHRIFKHFFPEMKI